MTRVQVRRMKVIDLPLAAARLNAKVDEAAVRRRASMPTSIPALEPAARSTKAS
jgi:hypothetical protein